MFKSTILSLLILLLACSTLAAERPRVSLDISTAVSSGAIIHVHPGDSLQTAINSASQGDIIEVDPGTYVGTFAFNNKIDNGKWLTIRSSNFSLLPSAGTRVGPVDSANMPKLMPPDNLQVLDLYPTSNGFTKAHHIRFIGIELLPNPGYPNSGLVKAGTNGSWQTTIAQAPTDIIFDRCYIHGQSGVESKRGIFLNSARTAIVDSYLSDFKSADVDAQAILIGNSPGVILIRNNFIEASGENLMSGGLDTKIPGLSPSDIEIVGNTFFKPLSWCPAHSSYAGIHWAVKNLFELKNATRVLVVSNTFENNWVDAQAGWAILLKSENQDGGAPWSITQDVTFIDNVLRNVAGGFNLAGKANANTPTEFLAKQFALIGNRIEGLAGNAYLGSNGHAFQFLDGLSEVVVSRNSAVSSNAQAVVIFDGAPTTGFEFTDNILSKGQYGVKGSGTAEGQSTLSTYAPNAVFLRNLLLGDQSAAIFYPAGNYFLN